MFRAKNDPAKISFFQTKSMRWVRLAVGSSLEEFSQAGGQIGKIIGDLSTQPFYD
jgi:hypothetical protein